MARWQATTTNSAMNSLSTSYPEALGDREEDRSCLESRTVDVSSQHTSSHKEMSACFSIWSTPTFLNQTLPLGNNLEITGTFTSSSSCWITSRSTQEISTISARGSLGSIDARGELQDLSPSPRRPSYITTIETDCLPVVFSCLDFQDLTRASVACKAMNEAVRSSATDEEIWADLWQEALEIIGKNAYGEPDLIGTMSVQLVLAPTYRDKFRLWFTEFRLCPSNDWRCRGPLDPRFEGFNFCRYCEIPWMKAEEAQRSYGLPLTDEILRTTPMANPSGWTPRELRRALLQYYGSWSVYLEVRRTMDEEERQKKREEKKLAREKKRREQPRKEALQAALAAHGLALREDSKLCRGYIEGVCLCYDGVTHAPKNTLPSPILPCDTLCKPIPPLFSSFSSASLPRFEPSGTLTYSLDRVLSIMVLTSWLFESDQRVYTSLNPQMQHLLLSVKLQNPQYSWMEALRQMQKDMKGYVEQVRRSFTQQDQYDIEWLEYQNPYFYPFTSASAYPHDTDLEGGEPSTQP